MCGRYLFAAQQAELDRIYRSALKNSPGEAPPTGEIRPSGAAPILLAQEGAILARFGSFGRPVTDRATGRPRLVINARAETVREKPLFRDSFRLRRCIVPADAFYEWDAGRRKYRFFAPDGPLYFAGLFDTGAQRPCFTIITTAPNAAMAPIHDRMPLILPHGAVRPWLTDGDFAAQALSSRPRELSRVPEDGQLGLFDPDLTGGNEL